MNSSQKQNRAVARFFSPALGLGFAALFVVGLGFGAIALQRLLDAHRISVGGFAAAALFVLMGILGIPASWRRGCGSCRRRFEDLRGSYPLAVEPTLVQGLARADAGWLYTTLVGAPREEGAARATLVGTMCPACARNGVAMVVTERHNGQTWYAERASEEFFLEGERALAVVQALKQRMPR